MLVLDLSRRGAGRGGFLLDLVGEPGREPGDPGWCGRRLGIGEGGGEKERR